MTERTLAEDRLRDANERLRESDRRKDEFLGMLSHELRIPLAPIATHSTSSSASSRVACRPSGPGRSRHAQVAHLTRLVDDLLDVTVGLALVRGLVALHGGTVTAASGGRGRGTEFMVALPVAPPAAAAGEDLAAGAAPSPAPARHRVLVVDGNDDAAETRRAQPLDPQQRARLLI